jgi:hypothetical protein
MRVLKVLKICVMVLVVAALMSFVVKELWNWLMPALFGLRLITWAQALGLLVLSKLLLGGFHKHGSGGSGWKRGMMERWEKMTPEERERMRAGMRGWDRCRPGRRTETPVKAEG